MTKIKLSKLPTTPPEGLNKNEYKEKREELAFQIGELGMRMQAERKKSLLVVFQGMDSSGKDGVARKTFRYCAPSWTNAHAFGKPTDLEFAHDFLWRVHPHAPAKGNISIFIRSHYEDVLIQRVHKWITPKRVTARFNAINAWEKLLVEDNDTVILKFFLNLSYEKQGIKLQERIDDPERNWKHKDGDWEQRKYWKEYMKCYEDVLNRSEIPWINVPADQRWYRDYFVANEVHNALKKMKPQYPVMAEKPVFER